MPVNKGTVLTLEKKNLYGKYSQNTFQHACVFQCFPAKKIFLKLKEKGRTKQTFVVLVCKSAGNAYATAIENPILMLAQLNTNECEVKLLYN